MNFKPENKEVKISQEKFEEFKNFFTIRNITIILFSIWFIDYLTTFIALNFINGLSEGNPFAGLFYIHWWGWIAFPIVVLIGLFLFSILIYFGGKIVNYVSRIKNNCYELGFLVPLVGIFAWFLLEGYVIIHNIILIVQRLI